MDCLGAFAPRGRLARRPGGTYCQQMIFWRFARRTALPVLALCALAVGCVATRQGHEPAADPLGSSPEPPTPGVETVGVLHVVQAGETLWRIARTYDVELEELAAANSITDPAVLKAGSQLLVPGASGTLQVPPAPAVAISNSSRFLWPVPQGRLLSEFGAPRRGHRHAGIDIGANHGKAVLSVLAGRVSYAASTMRGYGKTVIIEHGDSLSSLYAHNSRLLVGEGEWVEAGQKIAHVGRSGNASADHCHFEIRRRGIAVNPLPFLQDPEERH